MNQLKHCEYNNKDKNNSPNSLNDKNSLLIANQKGKNLSIAPKHFITKA